MELVNPRRLVTYFIYLNSLPEGQGCTEFPRLNLAVTPKRRRALVFCNVLPDGTADPLTVHRACPVEAPHRKYGMNLWITDKDLLGYIQAGVGVVYKKQGEEEGKGKAKGKGKGAAKGKGKGKESGKGKTKAAPRSSGGSSGGGGGGGGGGAAGDDEMGVLAFLEAGLHLKTDQERDSSAALAKLEAEAASEAAALAASGADPSPYLGRTLEKDFSGDMYRGKVMYAKLAKSTEKHGEEVTCYRVQYVGRLPPDNPPTHPPTHPTTHPPIHPFYRQP